MSRRQIEIILMNCLLGVVCAAPIADAQVTITSGYPSPTSEQSAASLESMPPDPSQPAPLRKGGFIQQLRALPEASVRALQEVEDRQFRLPPRNAQLRQTPIETLTASDLLHGNSKLPTQPSGRAAPQRNHGSPWLERLSQAAPTQTPMPGSQPEMPSTYGALKNRSAAGEQVRFLSQAQASDAQVDGPEVAEVQYSRSLSPDNLTGRSAQSSPSSVEFELSDREGGEPDLAATQMVAQRQTPAVFEQTPRNQKFDAFTAEALEQAPRVSRVPLPRSSAMSAIGSGSLPAAKAGDTVPHSASAPKGHSTGHATLSDENTTPAPERIVATPTSATPRLGTTRISNATLKSALSDVQESPNRPSSPTLSLPVLESPGASVAQPQLPELPATTLTLPTPSLSSPSVSSPSVSLPSVSSPSVSLPNGLSPSVPTAPASVVDAKPSELPSSSRQSLSDGPDEATVGLSLPRYAPAAPEAALPALPPTRGPSPHMPRLVTEGVHAKPEPEASASDAVRLKMEAPRIAVLLNGPGDLPIGAPVEYEIVVRNEDSIDLQGLILRMDIPAGVKVNALKPTHGEFEIETAADGLTMVTWGFEHLAAGKIARAPMQLVSSSAKNFAVAMEWTLMPIAGSSSFDVRAPRLELALDGPAEVRFGEPNIYRLHIRNPGTAVANQIAVRLSADPFGSSAAEIERIAPGEEEVIEVELTFNERGGINIVALAEEQTGLSSKTAIAVIVRQAIVESQLLAAPLVYHGSPSECRVRLTNRGDADARELRVALQLPDGASLVSAPSEAVLNGRELSWPVKNLIAGSSEEFSLQLKLTAEGANSLALHCSGPAIAKTSAQAVTQVQSITDLKLFVNDPIAPAPVGSEVVYELTLINRGSKEATNVKVVAQFSDGIEPIRGEGHAARVVPGQTLFEAIPSLAAGETVNLKVFAKAAASGTHRFRVEVRSDESEVRLVQEESTQYLESVSRLAAPIGTGAASLR